MRAIPVEDQSIFGDGLYFPFVRSAKSTFYVVILALQELLFLYVHFFD